MTEIEAPRPEEDVVAAAPEVAATFGRRLAAERERRGLSIEDVAARLRLHPRQVQAIENEALPALPAPFLRGFVRNYAKELRIDPAPLVAELSARLGPQSGAQQGTEANTSSVPRLMAGDFASRRVVVGGVLAALVALAVLGWLATRGDRRSVEVPPPVKSAEPSAPPVVPAAAAMPETSKAEPVQPPPVEAVAPAAATPSSAPPSFDGLRLTFREQSWVEVTQADGRIVHSQINAAGSEQRVEGKAPLRLVIGNASAVSVDYKGKPVDLKAVTSPDNVARITLN